MAVEQELEKGGKKLERFLAYGQKFPIPTAQLVLIWVMARS
jgi:hypothetical protein